MQKIIGVVLSLLCIILSNPSKLTGQSVFQVKDQKRLTNQNDITFGIRGGLSYYSSEVEVGFGGFGSESVSSDSRFGFAAGIFSIIPISKVFSFQPELHFVQKGGKEGSDPFDDESEEGSGSDENLTLNYLDLPLLARLNLSDDENFDPYFVAGPSVGYLLNVNAEFSEENLYDPTEFYKSFNAGFVIGAGADIGIFTLDLRYDFGLTNIYDDTRLQEELAELEEIFGDIFENVEANQKTSGFIFSFGVQF